MRYSLPSGPGAGRTNSSGRIEVEAPRLDLFLTPQTRAVRALVEPFQRGPQAYDLRGAPFVSRFGHGLGLQGVHAGQPADALLVEGYRPAAFGGLLAQGDELVAKRLKVGADIIVAGHQTADLKPVGQAGRFKGDCHR